MYRVEAASPDLTGGSDPLPSSWEGSCPSIPDDLYSSGELAADEFLSKSLPGEEPASRILALEEERIRRYRQDPPTEEQLLDPHPLTLSTFEQIVTARHAVAASVGEEHPLVAEHLEGDHGRYSLLDALWSTDGTGHTEYTLFGDDARLVRSALREAAERKLPPGELLKTNDPDAHFDAAAAHIIDELHIPAEEPVEQSAVRRHRIRPFVRRTLAFMLVG